MEIETPHGRALAEVDEAADPRLLLVLTHGSGGGVDAPTCSPYGTRCWRTGGPSHG